jgi:hypothetical protein
MGRRYGPATEPASHILEVIAESAILRVKKPKAETVNGARASSTPLAGDTQTQE